MKPDAEVSEAVECDLAGAMRGLLALVGRDVIASAGFADEDMATSSIVGVLERVVPIGDTPHAPLVIVVGEGALRVTPGAFRAGWRYRFRTADGEELEAVAIEQRHGVRIECHELALPQRV